MHAIWSAAALSCRFSSRVAKRFICPSQGTRFLPRGRTESRAELEAREAKRRLCLRTPRLEWLSPRGRTESREEIEAREAKRRLCRRTPDQCREKISVAFVPPKPNELEST